MKKLVILSIGIPGSGKTTLLKPLAERYGLERISRDEIRQELFGNPLDRSHQDQVWEEADRRLRTALAEGKSVVLDSTFATREKRDSVISSAKTAGADRILGIVFNTPLSISKKQNAEREHVVKEAVLEKVHAELASEPPKVAEGFDALYTSEQLDLLEERELKEKS